MGQSKILQEWCKQVSAVAIAGNAVGYVMEKKISITNHFDFVQSSRMELSSLVSTSFFQKISLKCYTLFQRKKVATLDALLKPREKIMPHFLNLPRAQCPKERIKKERIYCYEWLYECGVSNVDGNSTLIKALNW